MQREPPCREAPNRGTSSDSPIATDPQDIAVGGAIILGLLLLLLLLRRKRRSAAPIPRAPSLRQPLPVSRRRTPAAKRQDRKHYWPSSASDPLPKPQVNDGEREVSSELRRRYRDWVLIDNVMLPSGQGNHPDRPYLGVSKCCVSVRDERYEWMGIWRSRRQAVDAIVCSGPLVSQGGDQVKTVQVLQPAVAKRRPCKIPC